MRRKIVGIGICMLLLTTCALPVYGTIAENQIKKSVVSPGDYLKVMFFGNRIRSYRYHIPPSYISSNPMSLVVVLHGHPDNAHDIQSIGMNAEADEEGFIVVYPNGHTYSLQWSWWNLRYFGRWGFFGIVGIMTLLMMLVLSGLSLKSSKHLLILMYHGFM